MDVQLHKQNLQKALNIFRINVDQSPKLVDLHWWCKCVAVGIKASHKARNLKYASWQNLNKDFKETNISNHQSFSVLLLNGFHSQSNINSGLSLHCLCCCLCYAMCWFISYLFVGCSYCLLMLVMQWPR